MPNSTIQASLLLQIFDGLGLSTQPLFSHQIPPVAYTGNSSNTLTQSTASAYITIDPGTTYNLVTNPPVSPFLFVRNAGQSGIVVLTVTTDASPTQASIFNLVPQAFFLLASPIYNGAGGGAPNFLNSATLGVNGNSPVIVEYLLGV